MSKPIRQQALLDEAQRHDDLVGSLTNNFLVVMEALKQCPDPVLREQAIIAMTPIMVSAQCPHEYNAKRKRKLSAEKPSSQEPDLFATAAAAALFDAGAIRAPKGDGPGWLIPGKKRTVGSKALVTLALKFIKQNPRRFCPLPLK